MRHLEKTRHYMMDRAQMNFMRGPGWELEADELILQEGLCSAVFPLFETRSKGAPPQQFYSMVLTSRRVVVCRRAGCYDEKLSTIITDGLASAALADSGLGAKRTNRLSLAFGMVQIVPRLPERDAALESAGFCTHESDLVDCKCTWMLTQSQHLPAGSPPPVLVQSTPARSSRVPRTRSTARPCCG